MLKKFLEESVSFVVGKQSEKIAELLDGEKYINEFLIAKKLELTINQVRNLLYKLSDQGLVSFIRKKDKRKGWYTYFWKIEVLKSLEFLKEILVKRTNQINFQVKNRESKQFYVCDRCNVEFNEENALLCDFTCNECGAVFSVKDNTKLLREMKKNLNKFNLKLKEIDLEIMNEQEKIDKKRLRKTRKEEKERKDKLKERAKIRKLKNQEIKKKAIKSNTLKSSKKKITKSKKKIKKQAKKKTKKTSNKKKEKKKLSSKKIKKKK